ncbi:DUF1801 domain-containing protein [Niabella ginsengisoli]|uniref:DUF1801 domain-containing protein n=1 Tax=Niabella ginsengisoli TaxID=522298 RepID=A0ABS9SL16_9BACT|nr:DUF1801 domain-containing protein [Niabella ginsengisoli]MCH5599058.1 DUF1801 domain-containing protein [Niabella ginsengisoli]
MKPIDNFYLQQQEPYKSTFLALKEIILSLDQDISEEWKYGMPFFYYDRKMFCYLWKHKKYDQPYIGIVEGKRLDDPMLIQEKRARMKIMLIDPTKDIPFKKINNILTQALNLYKTG